MAALQSSAQLPTPPQRTGIWCTALNGVGYVALPQRFPGPVVFHWNALGAGSQICVQPGHASIAWFEGAGRQWIAFEKATGLVRGDLAPTFWNDGLWSGAGGKVLPKQVEQKKHLAGHEWNSRAALAQPTRVEKRWKEVKPSKELIEQVKTSSKSNGRPETLVGWTPNPLGVQPVAGKQRSGVNPTARKTLSGETKSSQPGLPSQQRPAVAPQLSKELIEERAQVSSESNRRLQTSGGWTPNPLRVQQMVSERPVAGKHENGIIARAEKTLSVEATNSQPGPRFQQRPPVASKLGPNERGASSVQREQLNDKQKLKPQPQKQNILKATGYCQHQGGIAPLPGRPDKHRRNTTNPALQSYSSAPPASDPHGRQTVFTAYRTYDPLAPPFDFFTEHGYQPLDEDEDIVWTLEQGGYRASRLSTLAYDPWVEPRLMTQESSFWVIPNAKTQLGRLKRQRTGNPHSQWNTPVQAIPPKPQKVQKQKQVQELAATAGCREPSVAIAQMTSNGVGSVARPIPALGKIDAHRSVRHDGRSGVSHSGRQQAVILPAIVGSGENTKLDENKCPMLPRKRKAGEDGPNDRTAVNPKKAKIPLDSDACPGPFTPIASRCSEDWDFIRRPDLDIALQSQLNAASLSEHMDEYGLLSEEVMNGLLGGELLMPGGDITTDWWDPPAAPHWDTTHFGDIPVSCSQQVHLYFPEETCPEF
ncbi:MAG: hypothetical protein LQ344_007121 [Seirophora lacunosa]|nr:MAG: hypothetical protein LQ344_007121 [Seirophora lacunosa]